MIACVWGEAFTIGRLFSPGEVSGVLAFMKTELKASDGRCFPLARRQPNRKFRLVFAQPCGHGIALIP